MANILVTPHWAEIQRLAELGVPLSKLAEQFGVNINTVWSQATKNDWLLPRRVKAKIEQLDAKKRQGSLFGGKSLTEKGSLALLETVESRREYLTTLSFETAIEAMEDSKGKLIAEKPSEYKALVHVARQALGMDTEAPAIHLSMFANSDISGPAIMESQPIEVETVWEGKEPDGFWE